MARTCTAPNVSRRAASTPPPGARVRVESMEPRLLLSLVSAGPEHAVTHHPQYDQAAAGDTHADSAALRYVAAVPGEADMAPTTTGIPDRNFTGPGAHGLMIDLPQYFDDPDGYSDQLAYTVVGNTNPALVVPGPILSGIGQLWLNLAPGVYGSSTLTIDAADLDGFAVRTSFKVTVRRPPRTPPAGGGPGAVRGRVFADADGDGRRNHGEAGLVGIELFLDANGDGAADEDEPAAVTLPDGKYEFPTVAAGEYHLEANLPAGRRASGVAAGALSRAVTVRGGKVAKVKPIGLTQKVLIAGTVFQDGDGDGAADAGEAGLRGWRVFLDQNSDGARQPSEPAAKTDRSGRWAFGRLNSGAYRVTVLPRPGYTVTSPRGGAIEVAVTDHGMTDEDNSFGIAAGP